MSLVGGANMKEVHTLSKRTPRISLFGKKNAIGIGKDVILLLGVPTHIRIRVNEENDSLVIEPTEGKEVMSFKVPDRFLTDRHCNFRIYSQQFVQNLMLLNGMDEQGSYSIEGNYLKTQNAAIFKLRRPVGASQVVQ